MEDHKFEAGLCTLDPVSVLDVYLKEHLTICVRPGVQSPVRPKVLYCIKRKSIFDSDEGKW